MNGLRGKTRCSALSLLAIYLALTVFWQPPRCGHRDGGDFLPDLNRLRAMRIANPMRSNRAVLALLPTSRPGIALLAKLLRARRVM